MLYILIELKFVFRLVQRNFREAYFLKEKSPNLSEIVPYFQNWTAASSVFKKKALILLQTIKLHSTQFIYWLIFQYIHSITKKRAKLLNADWSMKRAFFRNFARFMKRAKLLAHDWSSACLTTAYSIEKLFFCKNGISFRDSWRVLYRRIKGQDLK